MKKIYHLMMLCVSLCIILPAQAQPRHEMPVEKRAEMKAGKMKKDLNLSEKQYKKLCKLFKKTEKARLQAMQTSGMPGGHEGMRPGPGGRPGPGNGFSGGPGMGPGQGMPPQEGMRPGSGRPERPQFQKEDGDGPQMEQKQERKFEAPEVPEEVKAVNEKEVKKVQKILTEEQFIQWQKSKDNKKQ